MQRLSILSSLLIAGLALSSTTSTANAQDLLPLPCTNASFSGNYVFKYAGFAGTGSAAPFGTIGRFAADGNGNGDAYKITVVNGAGAPNGETEDPFTYAITSDCVATLTTNVGQIVIYFAHPSLTSPNVSVGYAIVLPTASHPSTIVGEVRSQP